MQISLQINNRQGYLIAFILLLVSYFLIFFIIKKLERDANSVTHSYAIINNLETLKAEITDAETGIRGYMITQDFSFLRPYNSGSKRVLGLYEELVTHTAAKNKSQKDIDTLGILLNEKINFLSQLLTRYQQSGNVLSPEIIASYESGKVVMNRILVLIGNLKAGEEALMSVRNDNLRTFFQTMTIMTIISLGIALLTILYSLTTYNRENRAKRMADANSEAYRRELEEKVSELGKLNTELGELRLIEKFAASGRIARTIAHEVRNPLTNISLAAEQVRELGEPSEERDLLLGMIDRSTHRINHLISDLLNSTRVEPLNYVSADVNTLIDESLQMAQDRLDLNHVLLKKSYDLSLPKILVDGDKIKLAFLNIIVNAIEALENNKGLLAIRTFAKHHRCHIEFSDNGAGMDEETQLKLFEPYFTGKMSGNGLGLTHTQAIILNHKGSISVESKPGEGSVFTIVLPFRSEDV